MKKVFSKRYRNKYIIYLGGPVLPKGIYKITEASYSNKTLSFTLYLNNNKALESEFIRIDDGDIEMLEEKMIRKQELGNYLEYMI